LVGDDRLELPTVSV